MLCITSNISFVETWGN